jgi:hypothetical protein
MKQQRKTSQEKPKLESINEELYLEVSKKLDLPVNLIKDVVVNGQSKFTAHVMSNNTFNGVRWPYFGVFKAKHKIVQILNYMKGLDPVQKEFFKLQLRNQKLDDLNIE